jgi:hypothetical protein
MWAGKEERVRKMLHAFTHSSDFAGLTDGSEEKGFGQLCFLVSASDELTGALAISVLLGFF